MFGIAQNRWVVDRGVLKWACGCGTQKAFRCVRRRGQFAGPLFPPCDIRTPVRSLEIISGFLSTFRRGRGGFHFSAWPVPLIYLGYVLIPTTWFFLFHTRPGLNLRSVGENPVAADTAGIGVAGIRYLSTVFGGMMAGLGGAYLSLAYTPGWKENMSSGQGWIAIARVIFALWNPWRAALDARLFGGVNALQFTLEARQITLLPSYLLRMLPYLFTILILVLITRSKGVRRRSAAPASLGMPFQREG